MIRQIAFVVCFCLASVLSAQTTEGIIQGRVSDGQTRRSISKAEVHVMSASANIDRRVITDSNGIYTVPALPPGTYWMRVEPFDSRFQPAEVHGLLLPVAGALEQPIELRLLSDAFEQSRLRILPVPGSDQVERFYGPDLDLSRVAYVKRWETNVRILEPSVSTVIDPVPIQELPFVGRDVFTMLATLPGVTSDSATARSLGLSANGIRPSSSNFFVDGVELNNYLISGPLVALPPESVQEYRISTNGYSAEYGRTAGYIANAVTRSGGPAWHGLGYFYGKHEALNANDFQNNVSGAPRQRLREYQGGYQIGGPITRTGSPNRLFFSSAGEFLDSGGSQAQRNVYLPSQGFLQFVNSFTTPNASQILLQRYPPPQSRAVVGDPFLGVATFSPPATVRRFFLMNRIDGARGSWRYCVRILDAKLDRPDFIWSPYPGFSSGLSQGTDSGVGSITVTPKPSIAAEVRIGFTRDRIGWDRAHPEVPTIEVLSGNNAVSPVLPGSPAAYAYSYSGRAAELNSSLFFIRGRQTLKIGGDVLRRSLNTDLPYALSGRFTFGSLGSFGTLAAAGVATARFYTSLDRASLLSGQFDSPQFARRYDYVQSSAFAQYSSYWGPRLVTHIGIRLEHYGAPTNVGRNKDTLIELGKGSSFVQRLSAATLVRGNSGRQPLYDPDGTSVAVRASFALDLSPSSTSVRRTVLRGGYGTFHDRPIENAWLNISNNSFVYPAAGLRVPNLTNFLQGVPALLSSLSFQGVAMDFPNLTLVQPHLPNGYAQDIFLKLQHQLTAHLTFDTGLQGSLGRRLLATDIVNRDSAYNADLPAISYLSSQGNSDYFAWTTLAHYRSSRAFLSIAYTWSHAIDNQSDPLNGDFFNLAFSADPTIAQQRPGFSEEFNSHVDRGNADFDQRHNLAIASVWPLPGLESKGIWAGFTRGWRVSQLAAFRSGFPFSVVDAIGLPEQGNPLLTRRADLINPAVLFHPTAQEIANTPPGGKVLLNSDAFCRLPTCMADMSKMGNTGRNSFEGPGIFNIDVSVSKAFAMPRLGESGRMLVRADAFNVLNHANLGPPESNLTSLGRFGIASFGRQGKDIGFPALAPFRETARQIQLLLRVEF